MRVVVLGGTGHIGTYLIPRLVEAGHEVLNVSRNQRQPYHFQAATWDHIAHSPNARIAKAHHPLRFQPRYTSAPA